MSVTVTSRWCAEFNYSLPFKNSKGKEKETHLTQSTCAYITGMLDHRSPWWNSVKRWLQLINKRRILFFLLRVFITLHVLIPFPAFGKSGGWLEHVCVSVRRMWALLLAILWCGGWIGTCSHFCRVSSAVAWQSGKNKRFRAKKSSTKIVVFWLEAHY